VLVAADAESHCPEPFADPQRDCKAFLEYVLHDHGAINSERVKAIIESKVSPIQDRSGRKVFRCIDVDGNVVEVFESTVAKKARKTDSNTSGENTTR
jgi:hypothetical protein